MICWANIGEATSAKSTKLGGAQRKSFIIRTSGPLVRFANDTQCQRFLANLVLMRQAHTEASLPRRKYPAIQFWQKDGDAFGGATIVRPNVKVLVRG